MAISALLFSSCSFHPYSSWHYERSTTAAPYDAVVIPGFPYQPNSNFQLVTKFRVLWARELYRRGLVRRIICSGGAVTTPYIEGLVMRQMLIDMGVPANHVFAETKAEHSRENIYYGIKMARDLGLRKVAVATDPVQCIFLKKFVQERFPSVRWLPIIYEECITDESLPCIDGEAFLDPAYRHISLRKSRDEIKRHSNGDHLSPDSMMVLNQHLE